MYYCFGCGEGGDVITFVTKVDGLSFNEAVERLAKRARIELRYAEGGYYTKRNEAGSERARLLEAQPGRRTSSTANSSGSPGARIGPGCWPSAASTRARPTAFRLGYAPERLGPPRPPPAHARLHRQGD